MNELVFIGLGLYDEKDMSLRGVEELKEADTVFAEFYTSIMPGLSIKKLEDIIGKRVNVVSRRVLEEEDGQQLFEAAKKGKAAFLVQGDPMIATTHVDLRISAEKRGIKTRVIHGASAVSAVRGISGLQNYKFGKSVTIPFSDRGFVSETPYNVIRENMKMELHTMCYLDIKAEEKRYLTVNEALKTLLELEKQKKEHIVTSRTLVIGVARAGSPEPIVKADYIQDVVKYDFGAPPHTLVFPGKLHFMEAEALIALAGAPKKGYGDGAMTTIQELITKYIKGADRVIKEIDEIPENVQLNKKEVETVFDWAKRYLQDAKYYQEKGKLETSLTSVAYCEGLLDALRLLGAVEFSW